ncbi:MAG: polysaccharide deacetylase family protein [Chloroflexota bacterium]|nr:polysaccharide deacetylase family protein [Dehalococcoidia bacterium]MDW8254204.1 polysaccharide deacetylase family protein [Chloroflexota bacterium]
MALAVDRPKPDGARDRCVTRSVPILMYHSIDRSSSPAFRSFVVSPDRFNEQMAVISSQGYQAVTVSDLVRSRRGGRALPPKPVVITFDDGFADFSRYALPVLSRYGLTATLYLVTGAIGGQARWLAPEGEADRRMLSWAEVREIAQAGIECGAHTVTHPRLDALPRTQAAAEIRWSKATIEDRLGKECATFAYPYGLYDPSLRRLVRRAGFTSACAVRYGVSGLADDLFALRRLKVGPDTGGAALARLLEASEHAHWRSVDFWRSLLYRHFRRVIMPVVRRTKQKGHA